MNTIEYGLSEEKNFRNETEQPEDALFFTDIYPGRGIYGEKRRTNGGKIDMRSALGEIYEDGVAIGEKRGEERGITIGKEYGISSMLELLQELGYCEDDAKFHLENKYQLSEHAADRYIKKYWNKKSNVKRNGI